MDKTHAGKPIQIRMDVAEYHIPAQDNRGHAGRVEFRVPPGMLHDVEVLLTEARQLTGWKTASEFYRWALQHGIATMALRIKSQRLTNTVAITAAVSKAAQERMSESRIMNVIEDIRQQVSDYRMRDAEDQIPGLLLGWQKELNNIDLPYWKGKVMSEFNRQFGMLLKPVSLRDDEK